MACTGFMKYIREEKRAQPIALNYASPSIPPTTALMFDALDKLIEENENQIN